MSRTTISGPAATPRSSPRPGARGGRRRPHGSARPAPATSASAGRTDRRSAFSERLVARASAVLSGERDDRPGVTRRSFLVRTAVVATALAANPLRYVLRPGTAYASVCGADGGSCGGGWTAFCCTIHGGRNTCPSGSYAAGWWKSDNSAFCRGAARYYIDCNRSPGSSCSCRCADGACDRRRVCCNVFRYGQCNTHIRGVTEVVCRVVTCMPPWEWDPACTTTVRTEPRTVTHTATCLPGQWPSHIQIRYQDLGLVGSVLGRQTGSERDAARGGRWASYERGVIMWHPDRGAHEVVAAFADAYARADREWGRLGYPIGRERDVGDGRGRVQRFERGGIWRTGSTGARFVARELDVRFRELGGPTGRLGYPTQDDRSAPDGGRRADFENGIIWWSPGTAAAATEGAFRTRYLELDGPEGPLGYPVAERQDAASGGRLQRFVHGVILSRDGVGTHAVWDTIARRYERTGREGGVLGYPTRTQRDVGDGRGQFADFQRGAIWSSEATGAHVIHGPIRNRYEQEGGPTGRLGYPTSGIETTRTGAVRASFEGGAIEHFPSSGETRVLGRRATRSPVGLDPDPQRPARRASRSPEELR
jgi:hypothetical protein